MTDTRKPDPIDVAVDRIISVGEHGGIRKIDLEVIGKVNEDSFDQLINRVSKKYKDRKPWEIVDSSLAPYIGEIEDEEMNMNVDADEEETKRRARPTLKNPKQITDLLGLRSSTLDTPVVGKPAEG